MSEAPLSERRISEAAFEGVFPNGAGVRHPGERTLVIFCYEAPDSPIGRYVGRLVAALVRRETPVHLFSRHPFNLEYAGFHTHPVGWCEDGGVLEQVQDFARRACNVFLQQFTGDTTDVTLLGFEWSTIPALSLLRGIKNLDTILSLHSLERQRSDMTSDINIKVEEIEMTGLREARALLIHDQATAEIAKYWVPECDGRIINARQMFPSHHFESNLDPGSIKACYQVGPIDPTILFIGDLNQRYGADLLIKAMPAILKNNKQARLIIVGDGTEYWPLRVYTRYLLLEHAVRMVGTMEGAPLWDLVQAADVIAVPSRDSTPWWPIQAAWAARRPVVATHVAAPGLVEHEQDSVLVYPSENSCVWGIERLLFDAELRQTVTELGWQKLEERFGWNIVAAQLEELMGVAAAR
jgi:glycosyltransferase involved in cell wall biosynthesis